MDFFNSSSNLRGDFLLFTILKSPFKKCVHFIRIHALNILKANVKKYIVESEKLKKSNPAYFKDETMAETFEGTTTYVSAKAAKAANYKYNVTCFSDSKGQKIEHIPFNELMPFIQNGQMDISSIPSNWIYSSGGLWCEVLNKLGNTTWQTQLNNQTSENPVTLYDLIKETID